MSSLLVLLDELIHQKLRAVDKLDIDCALPDGCCLGCNLVGPRALGVGAMGAKTLY